MPLASAEGSQAMRTVAVLPRTCGAARIAVGGAADGAGVGQRLGGRRSGIRPARGAAALVGVDRAGSEAVVGAWRQSRDRVVGAAGRRLAKRGERAADAARTRAAPPGSRNRLRPRAARSSRARSRLGPGRLHGQVARPAARRVRSVRTPPPLRRCRAGPAATVLPANEAVGATEFISAAEVAAAQATDRGTQRQRAGHMGSGDRGAAVVGVRKSTGMVERTLEPGAPRSTVVAP